MTGKGFALLIALSLVPATGMAQHNVRPAPGNAYNTHTSRVTKSTDFRCDVGVETVWTDAEGGVYAAFSNDNIWYRVPHASMQPLLYTAFSLGRKVCYQTKGGAWDNIYINALILDPRS